MNTLDQVRELFCQKSCAGCGYRFMPSACSLLSQHIGAFAVRIECTYCHKLLGVAIVTGRDVGVQKKITRPDHWTRKDELRLTDKARITYDDVLDAHNFFDSLGADWAKMLPEL